MAGSVEFAFSSDEMILALISLIRTANPSMLRPSPDGFSVDFEALDKKTALTADERLMMKFRMALESPAAEASHPLNLDPAEAQRLAETLENLEALQPWPADVLAMSGTLRARLTASPQG